MEMKTKPLYCKQCKKNYNVRDEDLELMKQHDPNFNGKEYIKGCFFKDLGAIKRAKKET
ncbi:MAG: hypothetical protein U9R50_08185 [Campylobacterota bacterium]|nr:hypothetical protein [Campylobacterota bacterium]